MSDNKFSFLPTEFVEKFKKLKEEFNIQATPAAPATPATFNEATLVDGTIVKWEGDLAVGTPVMVVTAEGEVPAPDGEHELTDGTIVVTVDGMVSEIRPVEPATEGEVPAADEEMKKAIEALMAEIAAMKSGFVSSETATAKFASVDEVAAQLKDQINKLLELVGTLVELPSENPIETPAPTFSALSKKQKAINKIINNK